MNGSRTLQLLHVAAGLTTALGALAAVPGCSGGGASAAEPDGEAPSARLTAADSDAAAKDLEELYTLMKSPPPPSARQRERDAARAVPAPSPTRTAPKTLAAEVTPATPEADGAPAMAVAGGTSSSGAGAPPKPVPAPPTHAERQAAVVAELMDLLRERSATSADPAGDAALLAILSSLDPAAADAPLNEVSRALSPAQQQALRALQSLASQLPAAMSQDGAGEVARLLERIARQVGAADGGGALALPTVALCTRVEAFGRYTPLGSSVLLAGRAQRALVYTEVENFAHQPMAQSAGAVAGDAAQWVVELAQRVSLYHADGTLAWRTPEETLRDASRNVRRDFYLVQRIDLPPTLSVGSYNLKVTVRDLQSGATAERVIPLSVVADPDLAGR